MQNNNIFPIFKNFAKERVAVEKEAALVVFIFLFLFLKKERLFLIYKKYSTLVNAGCS